MRSSAQPHTLFEYATSILTLVLLAGLALTGCGERRARDYVAQLSDPRQKVRLDATYSLIQIGRPAVMPLIKGATGGSDSLLYIASQILGQIGDRRAAPFLRQLIHAPNVHVREKATAALGQLGDPRQGRTLEQVLANDTIPAVRCAAAQGLGNLRDTTALAPLIGALQDSVALVRQRALAALHYLWTAAAKAATIAALSDPDETVRYIAAQMLGHHLTDRALDELRLALLDTSPWVRTESARALGKSGDTTAVSDLERLFSEREGPDHAAAKEALRLLTGLEYVVASE